MDYYDYGIFILECSVPNDIDKKWYIGVTDSNKFRIETHFDEK